MTIRETIAGRKSTQGRDALRVEDLAYSDLSQAALQEWEQLAATPLQPNPFYTKPALDALLEDDLPARSRLRLVCLRAGTADAEAGRLVGLLPYLPGARIAWRRGKANYTSPYLPCGTPLIARDAPPDWASRLLRALAADGKPAILRHIPVSGPIGEALLEAIRRDDLPGRAIDTFARPVATRAQSYDVFARRAYGRSRRKGLKRLRNALGAEAGLIVESSTDPDICTAAVDTFLALEAAGWKGAAGTALAQKEATRTMLGQLFRPDLPAGCRRIDRLIRDGRTIAISMSLVQDGTAFLWKTAFDETLRRLAPGIVLEDAIVQALHSDPELRALDSCTLTPSPLQDLYDERLDIGDLVIAPGRGGAVLVDAERRLRDLRRRIAGWLRRWRG